MLLYKCYLYYKKRINKNMTWNWCCNFKNCNIKIRTKAIEDYTVIKKPEPIDYGHVWSNQIQISVLRAKKDAREMRGRIPYVAKNYFWRGNSSLKQDSRRNRYDRTLDYGMINDAK